MSLNSVIDCDYFPGCESSRHQYFPLLHVPAVLPGSSARCLLMVWAQRWLHACQARNKLAHAGLSDVSALILYKPYFLSPLISLADRFLPTLHIIRNYRPLPLTSVVVRRCGGRKASVGSNLCLHSVMESSCTAEGNGEDVKVLYEQSIFIDLKLQQMWWNELNKAQMWGEWRTCRIYRCWKKNPHCHGDRTRARGCFRPANALDPPWAETGRRREAWKSERRGQRWSAP